MFAKSITSLYNKNTVETGVVYEIWFTRNIIIIYLHNEKISEREESSIIIVLLSR